MTTGTDKKVEGIIFNIQRYSIHDGPGIRTTVFLKGCPLQCYWCQNPESQKKQPEIFLDSAACAGCGLCVNTCPEGACSIVEGTSVIDRNKCKGCGKCVDVCLNEARRIVGRRVTVEEVMQVVLRDKKFYVNSGGGMTLSGGDPTAQPEFSLALLRAAKQEGLHTVIETCGNAAWPVLEKLLEYTDFVLYDIKNMDSAKHRAATGVPNDLILANARKVAALKPMKVRVPIIPGFNDSPTDIYNIGEFARTKLGSVEVDLLNYNRLGESKYPRLGRECLHLQEKQDAEIESLRKMVPDSSPE